MQEHENRIGLGSKRIIGYISNKKERSPIIELELEVKQLASFLIRTKKAHKVALRNYLKGFELSAD